MAPDRMQIELSNRVHEGLKPHNRGSVISSVQDSMRLPYKRDGALVDTTRDIRARRNWCHTAASKVWILRPRNGRVIRRWNEALDEELVLRRSAQFEQLLSDPLP